MSRDQIGAVVGLIVLALMTWFIYTPLVIMTGRALKAYWS